MSEYIKIIKNGLWTNNQVLVALLGLCPLLAVSSSAINAFALGAATIFVLTFSNLIIAIFKNTIRDEVRIPIFVLIIASFVTIVEILMQAFMYDLYLILGIFVPLIVTNCAILGRAEAFANRNPWHKAALDGFSMGLGFAIIITIIGMVREIIGSGTLFSQSELLFGIDFSINLYNKGTILMILPPGAFIILGLLIATKNLIDIKISNKKAINQISLQVK